MTKTLKMVDGDISRLYTNSGYNYVQDGEKVNQDVRLMLTTALRPSNGLGCDLDEVVGSTDADPNEAFSQFPIALEFQTRVRTGLMRFRQAQRKYQFGVRTPQELVYDFSPAEVWQDPSDPRQYKWRVDIITEDKQSSFSISGGSRK